MSADGELCYDRFIDGEFYECGRVVLTRDPTGPQACPSYGADGLFMCPDCEEVVTDFFKRAYDARARRLEWETD
jgi:hypothetical protein